MSSQVFFRRPFSIKNWIPCTEVRKNSDAGLQRLEKQVRTLDPVPVNTHQWIQGWGTEIRKQSPRLKSPGGGGTERGITT